MLILFLGYNFHELTTVVADIPDYIILGGLCVLSASRFADFNIQKPHYMIIDVCVFAAGMVFAIEGFENLDSLGLIPASMVSNIEWLFILGGKVLLYAIIIYVFKLLQNAVTTLQEIKEKTQ